MKHLRSPMRFRRWGLNSSPVGYHHFPKPLVASVQAQGAEPVTSANTGRIHPDRAGRRASSSIFRTVFQLRKVLVVSSVESKYCAVSLLRASPFGHRR